MPAAVARPIDPKNSAWALRHRDRFTDRRRNASREELCACRASAQKPVDRIHRPPSG